MAKIKHTENMLSMALWALFIIAESKKSVRFEMALQAALQEKLLYSMAVWRLFARYKGTILLPLD